METDYVSERLAQLHIEPIFLTGDELKAKVDERGALLNEITNESPPALPPLHWIILGLTIIFAIWAWREDKSKKAA